MNNFLVISSQKKDEIVETYKKTIIEQKDYIQKLEQQVSNNQKVFPLDKILSNKESRRNSSLGNSKLMLDRLNPKSHENSRISNSPKDKLQLISSSKKKPNYSTYGADTANDQSQQFSNIINIHWSESEAVSSFKQCDYYNYLENLVKDEQ